MLRTFSDSVRPVENALKVPLIENNRNNFLVNLQKEARNLIVLHKRSYAQVAALKQKSGLHFMIGELG